MTEQVDVTDAMLESAVQHHNDKIKNPTGVLALINAFLPLSSPHGEVRKIPEDRRTEFLVQLAKLE